MKSKARMPDMMPCRLRTVRGRHEGGRGSSSGSGRGIHAAGGLLSVALVTLLAAPADADALQLRARATSVGPQVRLAEVARLEGPLALRHANLAVGRLDPDAETTTLSLASLRATLAATGVNVAAIDFGGHLQCSISRARADEASGADGTCATEGTIDVGGTTPEAGAKDIPPAPVVANAVQDVNVHSAITLREHLERCIAGLLDVDRADLEIAFTPRDARSVAAPADPEHLHFRPVGPVCLGRVVIAIEHRPPGEPGQTFQVRPVLRRRMLAVVATDRIARGDTLGPANVAVREVLLKDEQGRPVQAMRQAVSMVARYAIAPGSIVHAHEIRAPFLVHRNEEVTVHCVRGALTVRTTALAVTDGALDDVVLVRSGAQGRSGPTFRVRVTGPRTAVTIRPMRPAPPRLVPGEPST